MRYIHMLAQTELKMWTAIRVNQLLDERNIDAVLGGMCTEEAPILLVQLIGSDLSATHCISVLLSRGACAATP